MKQKEQAMGTTGGVILRSVDENGDESGKSRSAGVDRIGAADAAEGSRFEAAFTDPDFNARPWVYWYWMKANVSRAGISKDLEDMAAVGIGGAYLMPIGGVSKGTIVDPAVTQLSEPWWEMVAHAAAEADRLGVKLAMNACDGWSLAGGPWITPELSMQQVVHTDTIVEGGRRFAGKLPQPLTLEDYYRDIAVYAYPVNPDELRSSSVCRPRATTNIEGVDVQALVEGAGQYLELKPGWIQYEFAEPFTVRSIRLDPGPQSYALNRMEVQVSDDGEEFRSLGRLTPPWHGWCEQGSTIRYALPTAAGRFFRFVLREHELPRPSENMDGTKPLHRAIRAKHIELSGAPTIDEPTGKSGRYWRRSAWTDEQKVSREACIPRSAIIDLSGRMQADGTLDWTAPEGGHWKIQRFGYTTTGNMNTPVGHGCGLEADKFSAEAARRQYEGWFGEAMRRLQSGSAAKTLSINHTDSWECGSQNWSPVFRREFQERRGYDPLDWLPVMSGVPVESAEHSERFLYDIRRTIADLIVDGFLREFVRLTHAAGARFSMESIAPATTADSMELFRLADYPMGEFWFNSPDYDKPNDMLDAISGGHIYGKPIIQAEAFTQILMEMDETPYQLDPLGAHNLALGINRLVLHVWAHQAFPDQPGPGVSLKRVGLFFGGTQTWHLKSKPWFDAIIRSQSMLQQGIPVVDICFFNGEEVPSRAYLPEVLPMGVPEGYMYDTINRDALLRYAHAREGQLALETGMRYRVLVLGDAVRMSPEVARKIGELAEAGVPVIGTRPTATWSLAGYPESDVALREMVSRSWGRVREPHALELVLREIELAPDATFEGVDMRPVYREREAYWSAPFSWNHRRCGDADVYFISNQQRSVQEVNVALRVTGKVPEIWDPATGKMRTAGIWQPAERHTTVHLRLDPAQSVFVVFRRAADGGNPVTRLVETGAQAPAPEAPLAPAWVEDGALWASRSGAWTLTFSTGQSRCCVLRALPEPQEAAGPWTVHFSPRRGTPESIELKELCSLSEHPDHAVRHYAGTAVYATGFTFTPAAGVPADAIRYYLDLGAVSNVAEVFLNDRYAGTFWRPPFVLEVTGLLRSGTNTLRVEVANTWRNRLIGDGALPEQQRIGWAMMAMHEWFAADTPLTAAGLIGPVRVVAAMRADATGTDTGSLE